MMPLVALRTLLLAELEAQRPTVGWMISLVRRNDGGVRFFVTRTGDSPRISGRYATVACEEINAETARQL